MVSSHGFVGGDRGGEADSPLCQRARFVGDQQIKIPQIFDTNQALHQHLILGEGAGSGGKACADHRRKQLRRDPHRDCQGEQQRLDQRALQKEVRDEDQAREHDRDLEEEQGEAAEALLEFCLRLSRCETDRDSAEDGARSGTDNDTGATARLHHCAHE